MNYQERVLELANKLENYSPEEITDTPLEELLSFLPFLEEIVQDTNPTPDMDGGLENAFQVIQGFYQGLIIRMEKDQARKILAATKPWPWLRNYYFYKDYQDWVTREQSLVEFAPYDRVAYIGGGALPLSLILYQHLFGIRGVSIERDPELAELSWKVLQKLDLASHIQVIHGDETFLAEIEFEGYIVDAQAQPRRQVFNHLHAATLPEAKIVYRSYYGPPILCPPVQAEDLAGFERLDQCPPTGRVKNISVAIRKL